MAAVGLLTNSALSYPFDHPLITGALFYPSRVWESDLPRLAGGEVLHIPVGDDTLGAFWWHPHPQAATVLFFHGNGEVMTDYLCGFHEAISGLGLNFLVVDYRGYGLSTGSPSLSRLLQDAQAAWEYAVGPLALSGQELIVMGRSLGSLAGLELAGRHGGEMRGLIIESGIARLDEWVDRMGMFLIPFGINTVKLKTSLQEAFNHEAKIQAAACPLLILHTIHDAIVPVENARALAAFARPGQATLHLFPRGGHNDIQFVNRREYFQVIQEYVKVLGK
jgi:pimeloyl-ACP methyl ester carboxylesterase